MLNTNKKQNQSNFLVTLKTPANAGAKSYTQKGVGCLPRVSTEQQSLESQLDRLREETHRYGYKDEDVVIVSGVDNN